jgi:hypothetical protein
VVEEEFADELPVRASPTQIHTRLAVAPAVLALGERQQGRS